VSLRPTGSLDGLDGNRIIRQAQAILEPPAPEPPKPVVYEALPAPKKLRVRNMANGGVELWDLTFQTWADVKSVKHLNAGDEFDAVAIAHHPLCCEYYMTAISYNNSGQSDVPFEPWGANVDDLEDYPVEVPTPAPEPQPATEPSQASAPEPSPPAPQITYSELATLLKFVTNKAPTNVYDLDMDTFTKITAVREVPEGAPFVAVSKAQVVDGSETTYYVDDQSQSINSADLSPAPDDSAGEKVPVKVTPPDPYKNFNYKDFPDGPKLFHGVGTAYIDDLNPINPKPQETLLDKQPIWLNGTFEDNGESHYRSVKSIENGDWYAIPTSTVAHDNEVDHLSSQTISMSNGEKLNYKQKVLARIGTTAGLLKWLYLKAYFKTKRG